MRHLAVQLYNLIATRYTNPRAVSNVRSLVEVRFVTGYIKHHSVILLGVTRFLSVGRIKQY